MLRLLSNLRDMPPRCGYHRAFHSAITRRPKLIARGLTCHQSLLARPVVIHARHAHTSFDARTCAHAVLLQGRMRTLS